MITPSATLATEQKKTHQVPVATVTITDRYIGIPRRRWTLLVSDAVNDGHTLMRVAYDQSFIRARHDAATGKVYAQRITSPTTASQWTTWTEIATAGAACPIALASDGTSEIALAYIAATPSQTVYLVHSHDNGQTWSAPETVVTTGIGRHIEAIALSLNVGRGTLYCFFVDRDNATSADTIYTTTRP
jgi:hypothetical protein